LILHIPHSSTNTCKVTFGGDITRELNIMTDWYTDELFDYPYTDRVILDVSRLVCDVERYSDPALEAMEKYGMGVCYTKRFSGEALRMVDSEERERIIEMHYKPHHRRLETVIRSQLDVLAKVFVVDCHSFYGTQLTHEEDSNRPDICIGTDPEHTPIELIDELLEYFANNGLTVAINSPFAGTMVPTVYRSNHGVKSLMIEVNRSLYLDDNFQKSESFESVKDLITGALNIISRVENSYYVESFANEILELECQIEHNEEQSWYFKSGIQSHNDKLHGLIKNFETLRSKINSRTIEQLTALLKKEECKLLGAEGKDGGGSRWIRSMHLGSIKRDIKALKLYLNIKNSVGDVSDLDFFRNEKESIHIY